MKGKSDFSKKETETIIALIEQKVKAGSVEQKNIRRRIRALGFYASDFNLAGGYTVEDFLRVINTTTRSRPDFGKQKNGSAQIKEGRLNGSGDGLKIEGLRPVAGNNCRILILGSMPGAESLKQQAYYAHPRNLFWKLISHIAGRVVPENYEARKNFITAHQIALWDICHSCIREGSLDTAISKETPNDIPGFVSAYPTIRAIAFNGKTAERLFGKHIRSIPGIELLPLPSTSPANAGISWNEKLAEWRKLKNYLP